MISVVLATHNEERNLDACLSSVIEFADEIIIADGESNDNTLKIAKQYKAKIISTTNKPNFHINKQLAMDQAQGDLVLQLDADEVVDEELKQFIINEHRSRVINKSISLFDEPVAWWLKRKNFFLGSFLKKGGQYPDPVIRLYVKGRAKLPQKDVHEQMSVDGEIGWAHGHLLHYSYPQFKDYLKKFKTYTTFQALLKFQSNQKITTAFIAASLFTKPIFTFFNLYIRHKGFVDGYRGFVFAAMSALHHPIVLIKLIKLSSRDKLSTSI